jgi:hypothetical protein
MDNKNTNNNNFLPIPTIQGRTMPFGLLVSYILNDNKTKKNFKEEDNIIDIKIWEKYVECIIKKEDLNKCRKILDLN